MRAVSSATWPRGLVEILFHAAALDNREVIVIVVGASERVDLVLQAPKLPVSGVGCRQPRATRARDLDALLLRGEWHQP